MDFMLEAAIGLVLLTLGRAVPAMPPRDMSCPVGAAVANGCLKGHEALSAKVMLAVEAIGLLVEIDGAIELE
jgi:hypothetical protein